MQPDSSGYVSANGVDYWFEVHGSGEPLLLLHGGLFSTGMFGPTLAKLAETRRVIGIDLHGHGHTALGDRKIDAVDIGRDEALGAGADGEPRAARVLALHGQQALGDGDGIR